MFACSFSNGFYRATSPAGKHSVLFEDSDLFGPSKINPRTGEPLDGEASMVPERLKWFWAWYPKWRELRRPCTGHLETPIGEIWKAQMDLQA